MRRKILILILMLVTVTGIIHFNNDIKSTGVGNEKPKAVITLGKDLTPEQRRQVLEIFGGFKQGKEVRIITVSNREEKQFLQGLVEERLIGTRAISSAYVELLERSNGIEVKTENITAITPFMYANALTTAGIEDARVIVAAPFKVSGTAALTGIIKAFETASGEKLDLDAKQTAYAEITETAGLGQKIGKENAEKLIFDVKSQVLDKNISDPQEIRKIIVEISGNLNVNLSENDIQDITKLMIKINSLDITVNDVGQQLKLLDRNLNELRGTTAETKSFIQQIISFLQNIVIAIRNALG